MHRRYLHDLSTADVLVDSGVPVAFVTPTEAGDKWKYVLSVLEALHDGGSQAPAASFAFIGAWLSDRLHEAPPDRVRRRIVNRLGRQGWHVKDGLLVIGERTSADASALAPLDRDARVASLHPNVRQVAEKYLDSDHAEVAIFEAFKAINNRVKEMTGIDEDGQSLMGRAMRDAEPQIQFADLSTETGRSIQAGFRFLFMGAVGGIRNPDAHEEFRPLSDEEAFEALSFASMLMRRLDSTVAPSRPEGRHTVALRCLDGPPDASNSVKLQVYRVPDRALPRDWRSRWGSAAGELLRKCPPFDGRRAGDPATPASGHHDDPEPARLDDPAVGVEITALEFLPAEPPGFSGATTIASTRRWGTGAASRPQAT